MMYDSIIIGAGPAGIVSAVQMKRAGLNVALFEKGEVGGLLRNANFVENYLGFPDGISGRELLKYFQDHLCKQKVPLIKEEVVEIKLKDGVYSVYSSENEYSSSTVVVATGTKPKKADIQGEGEYAGLKVFYEVADLPERGQGKSVCIVGGGDAAFDYALNLFDRRYIPNIVSRSEVSCLPLLKDRAEEKGISYKQNQSITQFLKIGDKISVQYGGTSQKADYVLIAVGREPRYPQMAEQNSDGLYFVGDVRSGRYRQVHIALGDALRTAMEISHSLSSPQV